MSHEDLNPINFTLSDRAIAAIADMNRQAEEEAGTLYWPCIMWAYIRNSAPESGGVGIGYMERDRVDPVHLSQIGDFKFIYGVIERDQPHFAGKTLDMQDGRLVLVN